MKIKRPIPVEEPRSLEDRAWDLWGERLLEQETQHLLAAIQAERGTPQADARQAFFARHEKQHLTLITRHMQRLGRRHFVHSTLPRLLRAAAIVLAVLTLAGGVALAASPDLRVQVMKLLVHTTPQYTQLKLVPDEDGSFVVPAEWQGDNYLSYVPEGLEVSQVIGREGFSVVQYHDRESGKIKLNFSENGPNSELNVDTEDAVTKQVMVGMHPATLIRKDEYITLYWSEGHRVFILSMTGFDEDSVIRVAIGVRIVKID